MRFGDGFEEIYRAYMDRSFWTQDQVLEFQNHRLAAFLSVVFRCPPDETLEKFAQQPVMTKRDAHRYFQPMELSHYPHLRHHTSGTTGEGLFFYNTKTSEQEQWAVWWRHRSWHGIPRDEWSCYFGGQRIVPLHHRKPPFWRENL
ncbi:MAG TPA: hypothetical protein VN963_05150, partial [bacterium]|nr:hypothetical protein [bacterium]